MAAFICDASGIVKRYLHEAGSNWMQNLADPAASHEIFLTRLPLVEVTAAVTRRGRGGTLSGPDAAAILTQFRQDIAHQYNIVEITPALLSSATALAETHGLRAYDAVQLAATVELHGRRQANGLSRLTLISADQELNAAATTEGLLVDDPSLHP
jgi:predicted nucleic acid-binding protein